MKIKALPVAKWEKVDGLLMRGLIRDQLKGVNVRIEIRRHNDFDSYGLYALTVDSYTGEWVITSCRCFDSTATLKYVKIALEDIFKRDLGI